MNSPFDALNASKVGLEAAEERAEAIERRRRAVVSVMTTIAGRALIAMLLRDARVPGDSAYVPGGQAAERETLFRLGLKEFAERLRDQLISWCPDLHQQMREENPSG